MTTRLSPRLTKNSAGDYDLVLENGKFKWATDGTQIAQHGLERLLIFKGEPSLGDKLTDKENEGTYWYETIFATSASRAEKELEIKSRILGTPGVIRIVEFNWTQSGHNVTISGIVQTEFGEVDVSQTIEVL